MESKLFRLFLLSLLATTGSPQTTDPLKPKQPIAIVAGQAVYEEDLAPLLQAPLRQLRNQEYEIKGRALESLVNQKLVEAEAKTKGVAGEKLLAQEVDSKLSDPTDGEVEAYYLGQKDRINRPFDDVKAQLRQTLKQARLQEARQNYFKRLREKAAVTILLRPPRVEVGYDPTRLRGNPKAPVTIVEFSDFQCPYCQRVQATINEVLAKYDGRVRLAYRDFPLHQIHPQAQRAAEASRCAAEQGKFWEYHDAILANPSKLNDAGLAEHARTLSLDAKQFDSCLASGKFRKAVEEDQQEGMRAGVSGTPGFFVNGVFLSGAQPASAFEKIIEAELAAAR